METVHFSCTGKSFSPGRRFLITKESKPNWPDSLGSQSHGYRNTYKMASQAHVSG